MNLFDFPSAMATGLQAMRAERDAKRDSPDAWHLSGTFHCHRRRIMERAGAERFVPEPKSVESLAVLAYGDEAERMIRRAVERWVKSGLPSAKDVWLHWQVPLSIPEWDAVGTADLIVAHFDGRRGLYDLKSASSKSFAWKVGRGDVKDNAGQLTAYARGMAEGRTWGWPDETGLCYFDKEYGNMAMVPVDAKALLPEVEQDYLKLNEEWGAFKSRGILPEEMPFQEVRSRSNKHVTSGRAKMGEMAPQGLCSPLYCQQIAHCPIISAWWAEHGRKG